MLLVIYILVSFFTIFSQGGMMIFFIGSCSFLLLSIRFVFLLEIKSAVIIGLVTCIGSGIGQFIFMEYFFKFFSFEERVLIIFDSMILIFIIFLLNILILFLNIRTNAKEEAIVKRKIIEFGKKIARIKIKDISEKSNVDTRTVFRTLIEPSEVFPEGVIEWDALDNIEGITNPNQMLWSLIYRKLKGNRGCTSITEQESEKLINLIRVKNRDTSLPEPNPLTFDIVDLLYREL